MKIEILGNVHFLFVKVEILMATSLGWVDGGMIQWVGIIKMILRFAHKLKKHKIGVNHLVELILSLFSGLS